MAQRILFISNGHGEDLNACAILQSLRTLHPDLEISALPIVGSGGAYQKLGVPLIVPTKTFPSGGFVYMSYAQAFADVRAGVLNLAMDQLRAVREFGQAGGLVFATGDVVVLALALMSGCRFGAFLVSSSGFYEGKMRLPWLAQWAVNSSRCGVVYTRDRFSAELLQQGGLAKAEFQGYPIMDVLEPMGQDLHLIPDRDMIALLPGSRMPECGQNLILQLKLTVLLQQTNGFSAQFYGAIVPQLWDVLSELVQPIGWQEVSAGKLVHAESGVVVNCFNNAFSDILHHCHLAIGMAGTAVEQAVGLGKPVIQIPGQGPQFTYRFAEAQNRLLGTSVRTIGFGRSEGDDLLSAAQEIPLVLQDKKYLAECVINGEARVGKPGGSMSIAQSLAKHLGL